MTRWHSLDAKQVLGLLQARPDGLSEPEAEERLQRYGPNTIPGKGPTPAWKILVSQFFNILIGILVVAAIVSAFTDWKDSVAIFAIVLLNGVLGFVQEHKAERALHALRRMMTPTARVFRDGLQYQVDATTLVPGDVIRLEAGEKVSADAYLLEAVNCEIDEAVLTGESVPVEKETGIVPEGAELADRRNLLFSGTTVSNGTARAVVFATGLSTEFGRIAKLTGEVEKGRSPLQEKMSRLGKQLAVITLVVCALVMLAGAIQGYKLMEIFMFGISLAVAVLPEGLPAVVTITLALGLRRMFERHCLIRRLTANEALGSTSVICTDKTGTLTKNEMMVTSLWLPGKVEVTVTGSGYTPEGRFLAQGRDGDVAGDTRLRALLETGLLCNHAELRQEEKTGEWHILGDPTEGALVVAAAKAGLGDLRKERAADRESEFSFNSIRKRMTVIYRRGAERIAHVKGAPEILLHRSNRILSTEGEVALDPETREEIHQAVERMAGSGLRVLALAQRRLMAGEVEEEDVERELTFIGLVGILDAPRPEVKGAVRLAREAGIDIVVVTGDNALTAQAVARQIGIEVERSHLGSEVEKMSVEDLMQVLKDPFVIFARVSPEHKLRIVDALKKMDKVIAMTGDGVNDAPALKRADVGVAMGIKGTDVAREASDVVLLDDNFASIVRGTEEGRRQYDNIQKFTRFLLSCNFGEIVAICLAMFARLPLIMLPVHLLWMNLITDGLPALALGLEETEPDAMRRPPRHPRASVLSGKIFLLLVAIAVYEGLVTFLLFKNDLGSKPAPSDLARARTVAFTGLILIEMINVFNFRSLRHPLSRIGFFTNPKLLAAVVGSIALQVAVVYAPVMQRFFGTRSLDLREWLMMILLGLPIFLVPEGAKILLERRAAHTRKVRTRGASESER